MTDHPFGVWLDSDRTGPVPEPVPVPDTPDGQFWLSLDSGLIHLWCNRCTAGGDDYLGEWKTPSSYKDDYDDYSARVSEYEAAVSAKVREHQAEKHNDTTEIERLTWAGTAHATSSTR